RRPVFVQGTLADCGAVHHLHVARADWLGALGAHGGERLTVRKVAVVGGECTGKTALCQQLAAELPGLWVPEYLREFTQHFGRVPVAEDQGSILSEQIAREAVTVEKARRAALQWVACDSAPVATAIYSEMYFKDRSHYATATRHHASYAC